MSQLAESEYDVVWEPLPGSQTIAFQSRAAHTLYEGARGPGKTVTQLMRFYRNVGIGYGQFWRGVIFDQEFDDLKGLVAESKKWFPKFMDGAKWYASASAYKWVWPTGEELLFRHVKKIDDYDSFHGQEFPFIGWNELTKHATGELYYKMMSINRSSFTPERDTPVDEDGNFATPDGKPLPRIPLEVFSTTNPSGPGHNWVKMDFIDPIERGRVLRVNVNIFNPQTEKDEVHVTTQIAIFGSYRENPYLDPQYVAMLNKITDPNLRAAWLDGDWNVTAGGAFDDVWSRANVVPRFIVPTHWRLNRTFDWGSTHPFSVGWWAEANGEEVELLDGTKWCPVAGSLIRVHEWYGCESDDTGKPMFGKNKGLKLGSTAIAEGIRDREIALMEHGWFLKQPNGGPADNQIRNVIDDEQETIEQKMANVGVVWVESDKSPGSRINGLELARERIANAKTLEGPALYVMSHCRAFIAMLPGLTRDKKKVDDVDTTQEDHIWDETRYRVLQSTIRSARNIKVKQTT